DLPSEQRLAAGRVLPVHGLPYVTGLEPTTTGARSGSLVRRGSSARGLPDVAGRVRPPFVPGRTSATHRGPRRVPVPGGRRPGSGGGSQRAERRVGTAAFR